MNFKNNKAVSNNIWNIFSKCARYIAILSFFAFFCLKIELLHRFPALEDALISKSTQVFLENNTNIFLFVGILGTIFSPFFMTEVIEPLSQYSLKDLLVTTISIGYFIAAFFVSRNCKRYTLEDWKKLFGSSGPLSFLFSFSFIENNILEIIIGILAFIGFAFFYFSSFFQEKVYKPMAASFRELRYFSWPNASMALRFTCAICVFVIFAAVLIACLDWFAVRLMTFILSWTALND